jgi:hypothetical protein
MTEGDLSEQDRAFLNRIGAIPTNRKPISVWVAQALCLLLGVASVWFAWRIGGTSSVVLVMLGLFYLSLVVGAQMRHAWARWTIVVSLTFIACGSVFKGLDGDSDAVDQPRRLQIAPNERSGAAAGRVTFILLVLVLGWRLALGDPAKRYFAKPLPTA